MSHYLQGAEEGSSPQQEGPRQEEAVNGRISKSAPVLILVLAMLAAACGDDGTSLFGTETTATTATIDTTTATTTVTTVPSTTAPATTASTQPPPDTTIPLSAEERLTPFFMVAAEMDLHIKEAADLFNASFDPGSGTVSDEARDTIDALDAAPMGRLVPPGLIGDLERAVLAVYADLDSRIASLQGGVRLGGDLVCLGLGAESARAFVADLATARELATTAPPPTATLDSPEAGTLAARLSYIHGSNTCCDGCGGFAYDEVIEVDWEGRIFGPGLINAPFVATFDGAHWEVAFPFAG